MTKLLPNIDGYVVKGKGFSREVLRRIFSEADTGTLKVEDGQLDHDVWKGLDFGPHIAHLELVAFPPVELYESWSFGVRFASLMINSRRELPADLLPALFKNVRRDLFVDLSLDAYPLSSRQGHSLSIAGRGINDEIIGAIEKIKSLRELDLMDTGATLAQVNEIRQRCPRIETIHFDKPRRASGSN